MAILMIGAEALPAGSEVSAPELIASISKQALALQMLGVDVVTLLPDSILKPGQNRPAWLAKGKDSNDLCFYNEGLLRSFAADKGELTFALIDRVGFLRQIGSFKITGHLGARLKEIKQTNAELAVGSPAPEFSAYDYRGRLTRISDSRRVSNIILTFAPDIHSCSCSNQLVSFKRVEDELAHNETIVIAVAPNEAEGSQNLREYMQTNGLDFTIIPDVDGQLSQLYGAWESGGVTRLTIFIDKDGIVRWIDRNIEVSTHGEDVIKRIRDASRG